jgi:hypothetical protein
LIAEQASFPVFLLQNPIPDFQPYGICSIKIADIWGWSYKHALPNDYSVFECRTGVVPRIFNAKSRTSSLMESAAGKSLISGAAVISTRCRTIKASLNAE